MAPSRLSFLPVVFASVLLAVEVPATGSQCPAHFLAALGALDQSPPALRRLLQRQMSAYMAGSTGPDIAQTSYLQEAMEWNHPGALAHAGGHTGKVITNMLRAARALPAGVQREQAIAFALGWLSHHQMDARVHYLVNEYGGTYGKSAAHTRRHKHLELFECAYVLTNHGDRVLGIVVDPKVVPLSLINDAFKQARSDPAYSRPFGAESGYEQMLRASSLVMSGVVNWMATNQSGQRYSGPKLAELKAAFDSAMLGSPYSPLKSLPAEAFTAAADEVKGAPLAFSMVLKGTPPQPHEYRPVIEALTIDDLTVDFPDRLGQPAELRYRFTVNDTHLYRAFCRDWEPACRQAVADTVALFRAYDQQPDALTVPDTNLNTGLPEGQEAPEPPLTLGNPEVEALLARLKITDAKGAELSPYNAAGEWIALTGDPVKVWEECDKRTIECRVPFTPTGATRYKVELRLALANNQRQSYGRPELGNVIEASRVREVTRVLPGGRVEVVDATVTPAEAEPGAPVDLKLTYRVLDIAADEADITETVDVVGNGLSPALTNGPKHRLVRPDGQREGRVEAHYQARLAKPGAYSFRFELAAKGFRCPPGRSLAVVVKERVRPGRPVPAGKGIYELQPAPLMTNAGPGELSQNSYTYTQKITTAPDAGTYQNTASWDTPPKRLIEDEEFQYKVWVTNGKLAGVHVHADVGRGYRSGFVDAGSWAYWRAESTYEGKFRAVLDRPAGIPAGLNLAPEDRGILVYAAPRGNDQSGSVLWVYKRVGTTEAPKPSAGSPAASAGRNELRDLTPVPPAAPVPPSVGGGAGRTEGPPSVGGGAGRIDGPPSVGGGTPAPPSLKTEGWGGITLCTSRDADGRPLGEGNAFRVRSTIHGGYAYRDLKAGSSVEFVWTRDDTIVRDTELTVGGTGTVWDVLGRDAAGGLPPGKYNLTVMVDMVGKASATFRVTP